MLRRTLFALVAAALSLTSPTSAWQAGSTRPYVLLVSLDGFRHDYVALYGAPNLKKFATEGVQAVALIPSYPTSTFPNHLSIVTGLYPEHHGIVENQFYDPARRATFRYNQKQDSGDGSWYGGTPLWVLAEQQGVRAATFFWPGSDAEIQGKRPEDYRLFDDTIPTADRIRQVIAWFARPEATRPHFVTLYLGEADGAGHESGPDSTAVRQAVNRIDRSIGQLLDGLRAPINVLIVSDHGMVRRKDIVRIGTEAEFTGFQIPTLSGHELHLHSANARLVSDTVAKLNQRDPRFHAYLRAETPERLHYRDNPRIGDIVVMPTGPHLLYVERRGAAPPTGNVGQHGYDPSQIPEMRGIFYAKGPDLKAGLTIPAFENVHIYPLIANLLRLTPPARLDGKLEVLRPVLR